uniref:Right handed beta helix domain-containing protein n=1 Tax=viral metagenome TaxID=1070528 RepID=A0A6M3J7B3_9ZZZZ
MGLLRALVLSLLLVGNVWAGTYYASPTGSDTWANSTNISTPCSVTTALANAAAGDTVFFRGGTYTDYDLVFTNSGSSGNQITLKNYPGETPIFNAGFTVPGTPSSTFHPIFDIDGKNYITLDGLEMTQGLRANIRLAYNIATDHIIIQNCNLHNIVCYDNSGQVYFGGGGASNVTIQNNLLHDLYNYADCTSSAGLLIFNAGDNLIIQNNEMYTTHKAIFYKHSDNANYATTIRNNLIYNQIDTLGAIVLSMQHVQVTNNIIRDSSKAIWLWHDDAACTDLMTEYVNVSHNTVVDCTQGIVLDRKWVLGVKCDGANHTTITNNLVYGFTGTEHRGLSIHPSWSGNDATINSGDETDESATALTYNLFYSSTVSKPITILSNSPASPYAGNFNMITTCPASFTTCSNNTQSAPTFVDYAGNDFTLTSESVGYHAASDGTDMGANIALVGTGYIPSVSIGTGTPNVTIGTGVGNWTIQ